MRPTSVRVFPPGPIAARRGPPPPPPSNISRAPAFASPPPPPPPQSSFNDDDDDPPPSDDDDDPPPPSDEDDDDFDEPPPDDSFDDEPPPSDDSFDDASPPPDDDSDDDDPPPDESFDDPSPPGSDIDDMSGPPPSDSEDDMPPPSESGTEFSEDPTLNDSANISRMTEDSDDLPPPPDGPPPLTPQHKLPVRTPNVQNLNSMPPISNSHINEASLSMGLSFKSIVRAGSMAAHLFQEPADDTIQQNDKEHNNTNFQYSRRNDHDFQSSGDNNDNEKGFVSALGKFQGDGFEVLKIKATKDFLYINTGMGEILSFDLTMDAYVFIDPEDPSCMVLDLPRNLSVIFKIDNEKDLTTILSSMPNRVFEVNDHQSASNDKPKEVANKNYLYPSDFDETEVTIHTPAGVTVMNHVKGQSVEDILEGNIPGATGPHDQKIAGRGQRAEELNNIFYPDQDKSSLSPRRSQARRKELIDSHLKKPLYSVRRVKQLCKWINSLHIWHNSIDIFCLHREICNGLLLSKLMKHFLPNTTFLHLNEKPLTDKAAIENIEQVIGVIWRSKLVNNSRVPTSKQIFKGNTSKIIILLQELFDVYLKKSLYARVVKVLKWYTSILRQYNRRLPDEIFEEGDLGGVWAHFQSGVALFNIIYHFYSNCTVGEGVTTVVIDPMRITSDPKALSEFRGNMTYVFSIFKALKVEVIWDADDWLSHPDTEFIILQLTYIYDVLRDAQCSIPPAQGKNAGITSGPNGEPVVVGIVYTDTTFSSLQRMTRTCLLGSGDDSLPMLPIDINGRPNNRYNPLICPQGLLSNDVKIVHAPIILKQSKAHESKGDWNQSCRVVKHKEYFTNDKNLKLLRSHNQKTNDSSFNEINGNNNFGMSPHDLLQDKLAKHQTTMSTDDNGAIMSNDSNNNIQNMEANLSTQFTQKIKELEDDMFHSQKEMESREEELVSRYLDLESSADDIPAYQYEQALGRLEIDRKRLEDEQQKLQEHFSLRMASIKSQHEELTTRTKALLSTQTAAGGGNSTSSHAGTTSATRGGGGLKKSVTIANTNGTSSSSSNKRYSSQNPPPPPPPPVSREVAEKGWISLSSKMSTHNYHIRQMQTHNLAAINVVQTPARLKGKKDVDSSYSNTSTQSPLLGTLQANTNIDVFTLNPNNPNYSSTAMMTMDSLHLNAASSNATTAAGGGGGGGGDLAETKESIFIRFKKRLHVATVKWYESKDIKNNTLEDYINSGHKTAEMQLISVSTAAKSNAPRKIEVKPSSSSVAAGIENNFSSDAMNVAMQIREDEIRKMSYEDERRQRYVRTLRWNFQQQQQMPSTEAINSSSSYSYSSSGNVRRKSVVEASIMSTTATKLFVSAGEVDAAFKWLSESRPLILADRKNNVYSWFVTFLKPKIQTDKSIFTLHWKEMYPNVPRGDDEFLTNSWSVVIGGLKDILESQHDNTMFTLVVGNSVKALKNSGGRPTISIKCATVGECTKYRQTLQCIWLSLNQA